MSPAAILALAPLAPTGCAGSPRAGDPSDLDVGVPITIEASPVLVCADPSERDSTCDDSAWLRIRLHQPGMNRFAVGAWIVAHAGDERWTGVVRAGGTNHASGGPPEIHLGLGDVDAIDVLEIHWPDGETSRVLGVDTRRVLDVTREEDPS
jgi:hypothetical protein